MSEEGTAGHMNAGGAPGEVAYLDGAHWARLLDGTDDEAVLKSWLALQCGQIDGVVRAVIVSRGSGPFRPVAFWPEQRTTSKFLMATVNAALAQRTDTIREAEDDSGTVGIARLVRLDGRIAAVVGLEVIERSESRRQAVLQRLQWGAAWLELFERRRAGRSDEHAIERLRLALDALAVALEQEGFRAASTAALTSLAVEMGAARVSFGVQRARGTRVVAVSNTTRFDKRVEQVRALAQAMDEASDQAARIAIEGGAPADATLTSRRTAALAEACRSSCVIVQPFARDARVVGAMVFEWSASEPPAPHVREAVIDIAALLAPVLYDRYRDERWLVTRGAESLRRQLARLLGRGYLGRKMAALALAALAVFFYAFTTEFRVTADARLRGAVERVIAAPLDGYILEAPPRAGDTVAPGDVLVQFDDVEYQLERYSWTARKLQYEAEYAQALAAFDRAGINILKARIDEAEAQIRLHDTRIDLSRVTAPFEAVIVSGDLSQSLGRSVQRGEELFRIAPLRSYLVEVEVAESDVLHVREGAEGALVLASLPGETLPVRVDKITPVTRATEGANAFVVEAGLVGPGGAPVSPGMEGIVKINAGERRLIWIWTRQLTDWLRLKHWRWAP